MDNDHPIFLSYSIGDAPFALRLAADLKNMGINLWMDRLDMAPDDNWPRTLENALATCGAVIAIITPAYAASAYCQQEITRATENEHPVFPVILHPVTDGSTLSLGDETPIDFSTCQDEAAYTDRLQDLASLLSVNLVSQISPAPTQAIQYVNSLISEIETRAMTAEHRARPRWDRQEAEKENTRPGPALLDRWLTRGQFDVLPESDEESLRFQPHTVRINSLAEIATRYPRFALIGPPSSGKTTLLGHLVLKAARRYLAAPDSTPLPVMLKLVEWQDDTSLTDYIRARWPLNTGPGEMLANGQAAIYLDGLSEIDATVTGNKAQQLRDWLHGEAGPKQAIITCHDDSYQRSLYLDLPTVRAVPWDETQARAFIADHVDEANVDTVLSLFLPRHGIHASYGLQQLVYHPLLLSIFARVAQNLPNELSSYSAGFLLEQMVAEMWERQEATASVSFEEVSLKLSDLAFAAVEDNMPVYMPYSYALSYAGNDNFLRPENTGQFLQAENGSIRFVHALVQHYFASLKMPDLPLEDFVRAPLFDPSENRIAQKWDQVVIMMAGLAAFPDAAVTDIAEVDPYLAMECVASGMMLTDYAQAHLVDVLLNSPFVENKLGRVAAVRLLPASKQTDGVPILLQTMRDGTWDARWSATDALLEMDLPLSSAVMDILRELDPSVKKAAANGLRKIGESVLPTLIRLLRDGDDPTRSGAAWALSEIGDRAAVPALVEALHDPFEEVVGRSAVALGWIRDPESVTWLLRLLKHTSANVREVSANVLSWIGLPAVDGMLAELPEGDSKLRMLVIDALVNTRDRTVIDKLVAATYDDNVEIRGTAVEALGKIGGDVGLKRLIESLKDKAMSRWANRRVNDIAAEALLASGTSEGKAAVQRWQEESEYEQDIDIQQEGAELGPPDPAAPAGSDAAESSAQHAKSRLIQMMTPQPETSLTDLQSSEWQRRRDAVIALRNQGIRAALPHLVRALQDEDTNVRVAAVNTLGTFRTKGALRGLLRALSDEEYLVGDAAADVLKDIGRPAIPYLLKALEAPNVEVRGSAIEALGKIADPDTLPYLVRCLTDTATPWLSDKRICDLAARAIEAIGTSEAHQIVLKWRGETSPDAKEIIRQQQDETRKQEEAETLVKANTTEQAVNEDVLPGEESSGRGAILQDLLTNLHHEEWEVRQDAAKGLREYARLHQGISDSIIMDQLLSALEDDDWVVRWAVTEALAWIGSPAAISPLSQLLSDEHWVIRVAAIRAMMEIKDASAITAVTDALLDTKEQVREAAAEALGVLGGNEAADALANVLSDPKDFVRLAGIQAAGKLKHKATIPALIEALNDPNVNIRWTAVIAHGEIGDVSSVPALINSLQDSAGPMWEDRRVCDIAADALERLGTAESLEAVNKWRQQQLERV